MYRCWSVCTSWTELTFLHQTFCSGGRDAGSEYFKGFLSSSSSQEREALKVIPLKEVHKVQECKQRSVSSLVTLVWIQAVTSQLIKRCLCILQ